MNYSISFKGFVVALLALSVILSCNKNPIEPKGKGFDSAEEFLQNPHVESAKITSGIPVYMGDNPPRLAGNYRTSGKITKIDSRVAEFQGIALNSIICLYNQTASGNISFHETVGIFEAWASGGYITGDGGQFTIWQESTQTGEDAGLPANCTINVVLIMSGTQSTDGNIVAKGLTVITDISGCGEDEDNAVGIWWMWEANFTLMGNCSG